MAATAEPLRRTPPPSRIRGRVLASWLVAAGLLVGGCGAGSAHQSLPRPSASPAAAVATPTPTPTAVRGCGPANGNEPAERVVASRVARPLGARVVADIDGDGRPDVARLYSGWHTADATFDRIVVRLGNGRVLSGPDILDDPDNALSRLVGSADVNGDGRAELVVETPGNTLSGADIVALVGGRLVAATACLHDPYDGYYRDTLVTFGAHSNGCIPWCMVATKCMRVGGQPRLVIVEGATHNKPGDLVLHRLYWTADVYRLVGADLVHTSTYTGSARSVSSLPRAWPFGNDLTCGTAHVPAGF